MKSLVVTPGDSLPAPERTTTRCLPCVSAWLDEKTGRSQYIAEIRYQGTVPPPPAPAARPDGPTRHELKDQAFAELAQEVRRLPALIQSFEIVVAGIAYTDAEAAAQAVEYELPVCETIARQSAWARLVSPSGRS